MGTETITVELKLFDRGNLKAFADVTVPTTFGEITLRGFRVVKMDGQPPWVAFPSTSYTKDGKVVNNPIVEVQRSLKKQIADLVITEFERAQERV